MTTIICTRENMVGDRMASISGMQCHNSPVNKVIDLGYALLGCAGCVATILDIQKWFRSGMVGNFPEGDAHAILLRKDSGSILEYFSDNPLEIEGEYHSIGSGSPFALASLETQELLGIELDTTLALKIACSYDCFSSLEYGYTKFDI